MSKPFDVLSQAAYNDARLHGYDSVARARADMRRLALREARDLLRRAELVSTGSHDPTLGQEIANFLPHISTLV